MGEDPSKLMTLFNPHRQVQYCRERERCFFGSAPTVGLVKEAYGPDIAESWVQIQLTDLSEFTGCREKLSKEQSAELAAIISDEYGHYKLTELMLFFQRFKRCAYGRFYGTVDPMVIMQALRAFAAEREAEIARHVADEQRALQAAEDAAYRALRERYARRVPDAFTDSAPLNFLQYRLMGYDSMTDDALAAAIAAIKKGTKKLPRALTDILAAIAGAE